MKINKKGFTLIELLAVIVVLGIVMVIGATSVLPMINKSKKSAFAQEATALHSAASEIMTMYKHGLYDKDDQIIFKKDETKNNVTTTTYCISFETLLDKGYLTKKNSSGYEGRVEITESAGTYNYKVFMTDGNYYINKEVSDLVAVDDVDEEKQKVDNVEVNYSSCSDDDYDVLN